MRSSSFCLPVLENGRLALDCSDLCAAFHLRWLTVVSRWWLYRLNFARCGKTTEGLAALNFMDGVNQRQRGLFDLFDSLEGLNVKRNTAQPEAYEILLEHLSESICLHLPRNKLSAEQTLLKMSCHKTDRYKVT